MTLEGWNTFFQFGSAILLGLTFVFGAAAIFTDHVIGKRQAAHIALAEAESAEANRKAAEAGEGTAKALSEAASANERAGKLELEAAGQRERAAKAEAALLELQRKMKDRHLSVEQRVHLIAILSANPKGKITVECIGGNQEPCAFAADIVDALKASGWTIAEFNTGVIFVGGTPVGLSIRAQNADIPRAAVLQMALGRIGFSANGEVIAGMPADMVALTVGSKP